VAIGKIHDEAIHVYVGGDCGNSNIELHDVRFSIGNSAEVDLTALLRGYGRFISLTPATIQKPFVFQCEYLPIA
jgi:hypothetical protein